jgi:cysteine-S-conjugate beta-lyase
MSRELSLFDSVSDPDLDLDFDTPSGLKAATRLVRFQAAPGDPFGAVSVPIYQTATFVQNSVLEAGPYDYSRSGNPTRTALERQLAALEGAEGDRGAPSGAANEEVQALAYTSGMAAVAAVLRLAGPDRQILAAEDLYGGSHRFLARMLPGSAETVRFVDATDPAAVAAALVPGPWRKPIALLYVETPSNPLLQVVDVAALAELAHARGALLAVDGSLLSPLRQRPLDLGADLVVHSATKCLSGHSDLTAGVVATRDPLLARELAFRRNAEGTALAPFEAWLLLRGMKTLDLRLERQERTAARLAAFLAAHPGVRRVHHPGLPGHPGHDVHRRQSSGDGCLVSFETGCAEASRRLVEGLGLFALTVSFGGVGSTASLPCRMSHASVPAERRAGRLPDDLVRLSAGIEDPDDLLGDLARALAKC